MKKGNQPTKSTHNPEPPKNSGSGLVVKPGRVCQDCEKNYTVELMIPDKLWEEIQPPAPGHLCGSCILARIELVKGFVKFELKI